MGWGESITPSLDKTIPEQIPGFLGSPYAFCMVDYFHGLSKDILITKEWQLAASTVAWPLLNALNQAKMRANTLENENQLL